VVETPASTVASTSTVIEGKIPLERFFESPLMKKWEAVVDEEIARSRTA